ncbi:hypothetical protein RKD23_003284 [Streptomyces sp. SAI-170]|uniref:hypothetical protein n=1 Tax=Streptomyces sp. SAI-170 TaxID=3377729 RepID=UPI003C7E40EF
MKQKRAVVSCITGGLSLTLALMGATVIPEFAPKHSTDTTVAQTITSEEIPMGPEDDVKWP